MPYGLTSHMQNKPLTLLIDMIEKKLNSPLTSSCGRLFDGISAILSLSPLNIMFEGQLHRDLK